MRLLIIEDYEPVRMALCQGLSEEGFAVDVAAGGREGLACAKTRQYDVILLDLMLPGIDGLSILHELRSSSDPAHVLILSAKDALEDRLRGLDLGADDYLVKPFALEEVVARVRALVRRRYAAKSPILQVADLRIDTAARDVHRGGRRINLTAREYAILEYLAHRHGEVVPRTQIWGHIYDFQTEPNSNTLEVHVGQLRKKLEAGGAPRLIHTRRGVGYILREPE